MALLSGLCLTGLGQIVLGQTLKGIALLVGSIVIAITTGGVSIFVVTPIIAIDAYMIAQRLKQGQPVSEWDFFNSHSE